MDGVRVILNPPYNKSLFKAHIFSPGDVVAGKVVLSLSKDEEISEVVVEFKGKSHTKEGHGRDERIHENLLFTFRKTLFRGPFKMRKDIYEYPFSFKFPEKWNHKVMEFRNDRIFAALGDGTGDLPLPPSCQDETLMGACEIYYRVTASVPRTFSDWEDKITLTFSPFRHEHSPDPKVQVALMSEPNNRKFRLTDDGRPRELSKREAMKHGFHKSSDTYTINFTFQATAPSRIVLGQLYPVIIKLCSKDEGLEGIEPEFVLKDYELRLKARTDVRVPGLLVDHDAFLNSNVPLRQGSLDAVLPVNMPQRIQGLFPRTMSLGFPPPSFITVAVKRSYGLELKMRIVCLGEESTVKILWPKVEVLPNKMEGVVEDAINEIESGVTGMTVNGGEGSTLPAYGDHAGSRTLQHSGEGLPGYDASLKS